MYRVLGRLKGRPQARALRSLSSQHTPTPHSSWTLLRSSTPHHQHQPWNTSVRCLGSDHRYYGHRHGNGTHCRGYASRAGSEPFLSGSSGSYMEAMYESWKRDPSSVHKVRCAWILLGLNVPNLRGHNFLALPPMNLKVVRNCCS